MRGCTVYRLYPSFAIGVLASMLCFGMFVGKVQAQTLPLSEQPNQHPLADNTPEIIEYQPSPSLSKDSKSNNLNIIPDSNSGAFNMLDHSRPSKFWISGQSNTIFQYHPSFHSPYSGKNSFHSTPERKTSVVDSLYLGYQFAPMTDAFMTIERFDGSGLSKGAGVAGFTDLDVVRNPALGGKFYIARLGIHTVIPLSHEMIAVDRGPMNLSSRLPARRLEIRVGKMSTADFLNYNSVGSDAHKQFMNWTIDNDGSYDYPADTRGYTNGAMLEYQSPRWAARFLEAMMPTAANGPNMDWNIIRTHSENFELEERHKLFHRRAGAIRLLGYMNHAHMGDYRQAVDDFRSGNTLIPNITHTERPGSVKYGFGLNVEQEVLNGVAIFSRLGWNEGHHETYTYTETDNNLVLGAAIQGKHWKRPGDKIGFAVVSNGISNVHRQYLAKGGSGFQLGDGKLRYGRESILELYYTCHLWKGVYVGPDFQLMGNPGYNKDRGPIPVLSFRMHVDF